MGCPAHCTPVVNCIGCMPKSSHSRRRVSAPSEHEEQTLLFEWAAEASSRYPELEELFAVPNGGLRGWVTAKKLKAEGVKPGVEDVMLLVGRGGYHGLLLEMKRQGSTPSDVSDEQRGWHKVHISRGYKVVVARGFLEARAALVHYLSQSITRVVYPCP